MFNFGLFSSIIPYLILGGMFTLYFVSSMLFPLFHAQPVTENTFEKYYEIKQDYTSAATLVNTYYFEKQTSHDHDDFCTCMNLSCFIELSPDLMGQTLPDHHEFPIKEEFVTLPGRAPPFVVC
ncbi:MAG: hypothetical protein ACLFUC_08800 [Bacteroidales bacterium]